MLVTDGVVDPRVRRTRQVLQQAFLDLLMQKSFEAVTVKDITEQAMVNRATFYAHFEDKYALLDETIRGRFMDILQQRLPTRTVTRPADLEQVVLAVCDFLVLFDGMCRRVERRFEVLVEKEIKALVADVLQSWLATLDARRWRGGANPGLAAVMASWAIYGSSLQWSRQNPRPPVDVFVPTVLPLIEKGIVPDADVASI